MNQILVSVLVDTPAPAASSRSTSDAERKSIHVGSLRITVQRHDAPTDRLMTLSQEEKELGITTMDFFKCFKTHIEQTRQTVKEHVASQKKLGKRIAGYSAAANATTLVHVLDLKTDELEIIAGKSEWKQGLEMPITRSPILLPSDIYAQDIDCVLILAWNFADEIKNETFKDAEVKFIGSFTMC